MSLEPFAYDGRILMIDMVNEPEPFFEKDGSQLPTYFKQLYEETQKSVPNHIVTIGLTWRFDVIHGVGVYPQVEQFHNYSSANGEPTTPGERNVRDDLINIYHNQIDKKPMIIGEFGFTSQVDKAQGWTGSEEEQLRIYKGVITGAEKAQENGVNILGVYNWCAFHFTELLDNSPGEQAFGVIRIDGSLKPAGEYLKQTYARWKDKVKAPWES